MATRSNLALLKETNTVKTLITEIKNRDTPKANFVFAVGRLSKMVFEEALNSLRYDKLTVKTEDGTFDGLCFDTHICALSMVRSGEAMEVPIKQICQNIKLGKVCLDRNEEDRRIINVSLPNDYRKRHIFILDPCVKTGRTLLKTISLLRSTVDTQNISIVSLFATKEGIENIQTKFPSVSIYAAHLETSVDGLTPFSELYFG